MGNALRSQPMPTKFGVLKTPVTEDVLQVGLLYAYGIIAASFILIIPGIRGWERLWASVRVFVALWIGAVLLVCNFGSWYADSICTSTQYKAHTKPNTPQAIQATVGLSISLRGINITLSEREEGCGAETYKRPFPGEVIHYVESFNWGPLWRQGRIGFGEHGGQYSQQYRAAEFRGMPYPVLWIAETFLLDGDQYRWYRKFRVAGYYTHILLWLGFATYLLSIILFIINVRLGGWFMFITGLLLCFAALTYAVLIQNDPPLRIHFPDDVLRPNFNYSFYLTAATGGITILLACVILLLEKFSPRKTATIFHHTLIEEDTTFENILLEEAGKNYIKNRRFSTGRTMMEKSTQRRGTLVHNRASLISIRSDVIPRMKATFAETPGCSPEASSSVSFSPATSEITGSPIQISVPTPVSSVPTTPNITPVLTPDPTSISSVPTPTTPDAIPVPTSYPTSISSVPTPTTPDIASVPTPDPTLDLQDTTPPVPTTTPTTTDAPVPTPDPTLQDATPPVPTTTPTTTDAPVPTPNPTLQDATPPVPATTPTTTDAPSPQQAERAEKGTQVMLELVPLSKRAPVEV